MPMVAASSVEVVSTARAQRMHRRISTEATCDRGTATESMLIRGADADVLERSESDEEQDDDDSKWRLAGRSGIMGVVAEDAASMCFISQ